MSKTAHTPGLRFSERTGTAVVIVGRRKLTYRIGRVLEGRDKGRHRLEVLNSQYLLKLRHYDSEIEAETAASADLEERRAALAKPECRS